MPTKKIAGITAKLGLDVTGVTSALKQIDKESKDIAKEMREVDKAFKLDPNSLVLATQKQELLSNAIANTQQKLSELESVQEQTDKAFKNQAAWEEKYTPLKKAIDETKAKLKELQSQDEKMKSELESGKISSDQYTRYQQELEATKQKMSELKKAEEDLEKEFSDGHISAEEYRAFQRELEATRSQLNNLQNKAKENEQAMRDIGSGVDRASDEYRRGRTEVKEYGDAVSDLNNSVNKVGSDLRGLATAAAAAVTAVTTAAVKAVGAATEVGMEFEASMSKVAAISGASADDLAQLEQAAQRMGATTSKSASESAQALSYMALAGWDTQQMLTGLEPILRAAEAGEMDLARGSDLITDSMSAMGISVDELSHYLDVLAAAQSNSNTSMEQLLEALIECGGTAHNFGLSVEDVSTALGVMANRGIKGSEAGNALNSIFVNMLGTTKKTEEAMNALGLELYDDTGAMKDMTEVLKEMGTVLEDATDEQRNHLEAMLGGKTQLTALQALVGGLNDEYDGLADTLSDVDGALIRTAKTMQDNLQGNLTAMQSALEGLGIDVYKHLEEPFKTAVKNVTREIGNLSNSVNEGQLGKSLDKLAESLSGVIREATKFATDKGIPSLIKSLDWVIENGNNIVGMLKAIAAAFVAWKVAQLTTDIVAMIKAIKAFKVAQEAATEAQIAANAAAMANVYAALAAAVAIAATAYVEYVKSCTKAAEGNAELIDSAQDTVRAMTGVSDALSDIRENAEEVRKSIETSSREFDSQKQTLNDCMSVMDKYRSKGAETEEEQRELKRAVETLDKAYGIHAEVTDGLVTNYDKLIDASERYVNQLYNEQIAEYQVAEASAKKAKNDAEAALKVAEESKKAFDNVQTYADELKQALLDAGDLTPLDTQKWYNARKELEAFGVDVKDFTQVQDFLSASLSNGTNVVREGGTIWVAARNQLVADYADAEQVFKEACWDFNKAQEELGKTAFDATNKTLAGTNAAVVKNAAETVETVQKTYKDIYSEALAGGESIGEAAAKSITKAMTDGMDDKEIKSIIASFMGDIEIAQLENKKSDSWLYDEMEKTISVLDTADENYKKYYKNILTGRQRLSDAAQKQADKDEKAQQKEVEDAEKAEKKKADAKLKELEDAQKKADALRKKEDEQAARDLQKYEQTVAKYQSDMGGIFTRKQTKDRYGKESTTYTIDTSAMEKKIKNKEKLSDLLRQLSEKGMPQNIIDELLSMDPDEAVIFAKQLLKFPDKFDTVKKLYERDKKAAQSLAQRSLGNDKQFEDAGTKAGGVYADKLVETVISRVSERLPDLSGMLTNILPVISADTGKAAPTQTVENGAQANISDNSDKQTALLETILQIINTSLGEKGINVTVNPVVETTVKLDEQTVATAVTKSQDNSKVRSGQ